MRYFLSVFAFCISSKCFSQNQTDTVVSLSEVVVQAFEQHARLQQVPAAVAHIGRLQIDRYNNVSIVNAMNTIPGVRMDERSPGSFRLNIRGSSLRSPFGVRNVKIYYNGIPYTDPGGHTYLNQLGAHIIRSVEIIKGPGSSLYGAGTGGVVLIQSAGETNGIEADATAGSYNMRNYHVQLTTGKTITNTIHYQHQESDGYRDHSRLRRDIATWDASLKTSENGNIKAHFLYGDLFYLTPGALNKQEYDANPKSARPRVGFIPGSAEMKAAVNQQTFLAGATYEHHFNPSWKNSTTLYGAFTQLRNPTIRNYARASEPHAGGRTIFQFQKESGENKYSMLAGGELQQGFTSVRIYSSINGNPDTLQTDDEIHTRNAFAFLQGSITLKKFVFVAGASINGQKVDLSRFSPVSSRQKRKYNNEFAPRLSVLYRIKNDLSVFSSISKGFSPPTSAEILPSTGIINTTLEAEDGFNKEIGVRGMLQKRIFFDVNFFHFNLDNIINQRRDATGGDFFINAGATTQYGVETFLQYSILPRGILSASRFWFSHAYHHFEYKQFQHLSGDFTGNRLPGIPPHAVGAGFDFAMKAGPYLNLTYQYNDPAPLNDANDVYAESFHLVGARLGFKMQTGSRNQFEIFLGGDNLLDQRYSLGNDINGFGGRYFNTAPERNYFGGVSWRFK